MIISTESLAQPAAGNEQHQIHGVCVYGRASGAIVVFTTSSANTHTHALARTLALARAFISVATRSLYETGNVFGAQTHCVNTHRTKSTENTNTHTRTHGRANGARARLIRLSRARAEY